MYYMSFLFVGIYIFALLTVNLLSPKIKITYTKCILCWYNCQISCLLINTKFLRGIRQLTFYAFVSYGMVQYHWQLHFKPKISFTKVAEELSRHDTNNCTNMFMHTIRLSNIFIGQRRVIMIYFITIFIFYK
jgi:hypothetical protein